MPVKSHNTPPEWVDPDDSPEWTAEMFEKATPKIGGRVVTWDEYRNALNDAVIDTPPDGSDLKVSFVFEIDADILNAFIATGDNWEARMNDALRDWMQSNLR
jgi:uncharacterized protein (DUF4415 family)